jgi:hypothetical protein
MGGAYSLLNDKWVKKPVKEDFVPDEKQIRKKAENIMVKVNKIEDDFKEGATYDKLKDRISKVWKKIKDGRQMGLEREGELALENLVFKFLRRNGYIPSNIRFKEKIL